MLITAAVLFTLVTALDSAAGPVAAPSGMPRLHLVGTIHPVTAILQEIAAGRAEITRLLPPGSSPHTFEPKPSDMQLVQQADVLFYVGRGLDQEWLHKLSAQKKVALLSFLPPDSLISFTDHHENHNHPEEEGIPDPHFWTDPMTVAELITPLVNYLTALDPAGEQSFRSQGSRFHNKLASLNLEFTGQLASVKDQPIILFHPSFNYLIRQYKLSLAGIIEPFPGKEPSAKFLYSMVQIIKTRKARVIFSEVQLSKRPALALGEAADVAVAELDPVGGIPGRMTYEELMRFNIDTLATGLSGNRQPAANRK